MSIRNNCVINVASFGSLIVWINRVKSFYSSLKHLFSLFYSKSFHGNITVFLCVCLRVFVWMSTTCAAVGWAWLRRPSSRWQQWSAVGGLSTRLQLPCRYPSFQAFEKLSEFWEIKRRMFLIRRKRQELESLRIMTFSTVSMKLLDHLFICQCPAIDFSFTSTHLVIS